MNGFVQILFDKLSSEMAELRHENSELRRSLWFTQGWLDDLKKHLIQLQNSHCDNAPTGPQLNETMEPLRQIEDENRKENLKIVGIREISGENNQNKTKKGAKIYLGQISPFIRSSC